MKRLLTVLLTVFMLFSISGCEFIESIIPTAERTEKVTDLGDAFIEMYLQIPEFVKVERGIAPAEIYNITTDFLVFEGEYEAGKTHGYITFMSYENVDAVTNYFKKLAKEEYKVELTEDVYGISFVLYNDNVPITISISVADLEEYGYFVSYEAMEMTYEQASKI
jgi:hypothetical protein